MRGLIRFINEKRVHGMTVLGITMAHIHLGTRIKEEKVAPYDPEEGSIIKTKEEKFPPVACAGPDEGYFEQILMREMQKRESPYDKGGKGIYGYPRKS